MTVLIAVKVSTMLYQTHRSMSAVGTEEITFTIVSCLVLAGFHNTSSRLSLSRGISFDSDESFLLLGLIRVRFLQRSRNIVQYRCLAGTTSLRCSESMDPIELQTDTSRSSQSSLLIKRLDTASHLYANRNTMSLLSTESQIQGLGTNAFADGVFQSHYMSSSPWGHDFHVCYNNQSMLVISSLDLIHSAVNSAPLYFPRKEHIDVSTGRAWTYLPWPCNTL